MWTYKLQNYTKHGHFLARNTFEANFIPIHLDFFNTFNKLHICYSCQLKFYSVNYELPYLYVYIKRSLNAYFCLASFEEALAVEPTSPIQEAKCLANSVAPTFLIHTGQITNISSCSARGSAFISSGITDTSGKKREKEKKIPKILLVIT